MPLEKGKECMMKEKLGILLIVALAVVSLASCSKTPKQQQKGVKIAYLPITHALAASKSSWSSTVPGLNFSMP